MARDDTSTAPAKKQRWYHQLWQVFQMTRKTDPAITWILLAILVGVIAIGVGVGFATGHPFFWLFLSIPFAALVAMFVLSRRVEKAAFAQIEGQTGATLSALRSIRRGWTFPEEPAAFDPKTRDLVFRGVGRPGVVLVGEGPAPRINKLLEAERKRTARVVGGAPIIVMQMGDGEGQIPLRKLPRAVQRVRGGKLTKPEIAEVNKRLTALGGAKLPMPKGVDPNRARPDRKGMRGR
ncbi:DUF4191 domain-containing protein [Cellulomonas sp. McL0617]|uniref:DUF4191 domain-containing protein n=1 Tax=Cellulomonas sp. McL0617 TaxID=3415675 RepID=UPI003CEC48BD